MGVKGISINSGRVYKRIKIVKFKAKSTAYSKPIGKIFNVEVGFFERLDAGYELLEVPLSNVTGVRGA